MNSNTRPTQKLISKANSDKAMGSFRKQADIDSYLGTIPRTNSMGKRKSEAYRTLSQRLLQNEKVQETYLKKIIAKNNSSDERLPYQGQQTKFDFSTTLIYQQKQNLGKKKIGASIYNNIATVKSQQASVYTNQVFSKHSKSHNLSHNSSQNSDNILYGNLSSNGKRRRGNFVLKSRDSS